MKYLRKKGTDIFFIYTERLAARGDMIPCDSMEISVSEDKQPEPIVTPMSEEVNLQNMAVVEGEEQESPFLCKDCGFKAKSRAGLRLHQKKHE